MEDAKIEGQVEEGSNKMPLTFFLIKLLSEFRNQEVSNAVSQRQFGNFGDYADNEPGIPSPINERNERSNNRSYED